MSGLGDLSFDIAALHAAYAGGLSAADVVAEVYRRVSEAGDPGIFLHFLEREDVLSRVAALPPFDPRRFPLWGVPFAIKDNIDLAGAPTTAACPAFAHVADRDATVVARLCAAGAIPIGKTNLDQFATGLVGVRTPYPVPKNALDPEIVPGGSSSGSAVAVARGIVSFALGTDTAGSGRVPAALNNIVGLKPSLGALSTRGVVPACRTLDAVSVFALTVPDAWAVFEAARGFDAEDPYSKDRPISPTGAVPEVLRIGVPDDATRMFFGDEVHAAAFEAALTRLAALGAEIVELDFTPFYDVAAMLYEGAWVAERMTVVEDLLKTDPSALHPVTRQIISAADALSAADAFRGIYRLAELRRVAEGRLSAVDALCVPSIPTFYTVADLEADPVTPNSRFGTYTNFVNLLDMCGVAVPTAARADGRPGSVTILAPGGRDGLAAGIARRLHADAGPRLGATAHPLPDSPEPDPAARDGETVLAVVGAHMSGLPLNRELTSRGARFLEATSTSARYRLFALPGGPPKRPGLLRTGDGAGIALELWALDDGQVGDFLGGVPKPLSIGTVELLDGREVKGFLVEHAATEGATDITAHGGWRAFLKAAAV